jgi:peptidoglycan/LPS O-acetylase OafA/YrhL
MSRTFSHKADGGKVSSSERLPVLDGVRAFSILFVLVAHMLLPRWAYLNYTVAAMGMSLFFVLSGFLIASQLLHNADVHEFMVRRLARILPLAYAFVLFTSVFFDFDAERALATAAFLINYTGHIVPYNVHIWSLCVEMHFYLAIALVVALVGRKGVWLVWPACLAVTALRIVTQGTYEYAINTHLRVDEILVGACVATLYKKSWRDRDVVPWALALLAGLLLFGLSSPFAGWGQHLRPYAAGLVLAAVLAGGHSWLNRLLGSAPLRYIATTSYALYVIHPLTVHGWMNEGTLFERYAIKRPISVAITFAAAHLSTFYWERPWQQLGAQWIQRRRKRLLETAAA